MIGLSRKDQLLLAALERELAAAKAAGDCARVAKLADWIAKLRG